MPAIITSKLRKLYPLIGFIAAHHGAGFQHCTYGETSLPSLEHKSYQTYDSIGQQKVQGKRAHSGYGSAHLKRLQSIIPRSSTYLREEWTIETEVQPNLMMPSVRKSSHNVQIHNQEQREVLAACTAEFIGTFLLVGLGCGSGFNACLLGTITNLWQIASVWACLVAVICYCTGSISGAHLNPAISFATSLFDRYTFPWSRCWKYMVSQLLGAIAAAMFNLMLYSPQLTKFESARGIIRDQESGITTAMLFGEYFPNPSVFGLDYSVISTVGALGIETWATAILVFVIRAINDERNEILTQKDLAPVLIGLTVGLLILSYSPFTMLGMNPARDFGPRLVAYFAGYGQNAIPGPRNGFWIYILGPFLGASLGAFMYEKAFKPIFLWKKG
mmetsp:Transcript_33/g.29  ORF Transcript_33/g.29 Transcript_33/m.29 type:complete len:388 (+) Transcript_33:246-1409(+)|eukprot:CAMPEP_0117751616 /NCGR_PEP_ID=MMETSP0947-20121206/11086_1 /TAXON_ID=44440 /ORGANISM="Chattonella subsalsa, Strain CCMP2191" /LENGTH=387 /DNA_ID=CAMNT_0005570041 /DNA_START=240 /DNA_END=1403 /DNA_ORIENTATION=+